MPPIPDRDVNAEDDDLLLAVRFLLNECSHDEAAHFEARLADDSAAQQALVEATSIVAMLQATSVCPVSCSAPAVLPGSRSWRYVAMVAVGLLVALTIAWQLLPTTTPNSVVMGEPVRLGDVWAGLEPDELVPDSMASADDFVMDDFDSPEGEESSGNPLNNELANEDEEVPDWMLTAVLVEMEQSNPETILVE